MQDIILAALSGALRRTDGSGAGRLFLRAGVLRAEEKPSTSEVLDWIGALKLSGIPTDKLRSDLRF